MTATKLKLFLSDDMRDQYNWWAGHYDDEFSENGYCAPNVLHDRLAQKFNTKAGAVRVLDVGIGTGMLSALFRETNKHAHITGIDISEDMLQKADKKTIADQLICHNFEEDGLPFDNSHFDIVASSGVFEILNKPANVIREMGRVLKPQGAIAFTAFAEASGSYPCNHHSDDLIRSALQDANIELVESERFYAFTHHGSDIYYDLYTGMKR